MTSQADLTRLRQIQAQVDELSELVGSEPQRVLEAMPALLEELQDWPQKDAYLWCMHLAVQAFRFTDNLDTAVHTAELALEVADPTSGFAAGLHLEAGMSLNQRGSQTDAEPHLRQAIDTYGQLEDEAGRAWALVALADSLCGLARQDEALELATEGAAAARASGDQRALLRALKQRAVVQRIRGDVADALASIEQVLASATGHARANALLERGHILTMSSAYAPAIEDYVAANVEYTVHNDVLGLANTERALATTDLLLGRDTSGLQHLDAAADLYRQIGNNPGLGYALRERSVVRLARDPSGAEQDANDAIRAFEATGDLLGLTGAWRALARVADVLGNNDRVTAALANAEQLAQASTNPLALAGIRLMQAEIGAPGERENAALAALHLYDQLDILIGSAHAAAFAARAAATTSSDAAEEHLKVSASRLRLARGRVVDPASRADHDLSLRTVPATIVEVAGLLGTGTVRNLAADAILDSFPLALRTSSPGGWLSDAARSSARRAQMLKSTDDTATLRSTLQRLAVEVATLTREPDQQVQNSPIGDLRASAPDAALLVVGAPISSGQVPVVAALPGGDLVLHLPLLDSAAVDMIDALGRLADGDSADVLWRPAARSWQHVLGDLFLPSALGDHLAQGPPGDLLLVVHPTLAHLPFEALKIPGQGPLGVAAAVRRLPLLAQSEHQIHLTADVAFFDPAHRWPAEQAVVGAGEPSVGAWLAAIGAGTLGVFAAHGNPGAGFDGWLTTADQSGIVTAADLLLENLAGSAFVFEACWAGRHVGHRSGETLNMTTAALLSGASSVIAGLWALPADPDCTGQITADCLAAIKRGTRPAEALRRAREQFLAIPTETFAVPGSAERMERSAPWAWAGLCAFG